MVRPFDDSIINLLKEKLKNIENILDADVLTFHGQIVDGLETTILEIIEELNEDSENDTLYVILTTNGGSAHAVERYVNILRHHYKEINFIVPDYAFSAGTIFCMSGDNILMDYFSVLGPIDPQVKNKEGTWVPALGYLDKVNELITKAQNNKLSNAEFLILKDFDLAELRGYEQAKELTITLLENWLVKYKFKNWSYHRTDPILKGQKVTKKQKIDRAKEIGLKLSDNGRWKSHGRPINIEALEGLKLEIQDYAKNKPLNNLVREYYNLVNEFIDFKKIRIFIQTKKYL
jgi:hypothetical protein